MKSDASKINIDEVRCNFDEVRCNLDELIWKVYQFGCSLNAS